MDVQFLLVPYDSGTRGARMGAGPAALLPGLRARLEAAGHRTGARVVEAPPASLPAEIRTAFELSRALARDVARTVANGRLPIVLAGNCGTALGTVAGLGPAPTGVVWFDAHADFNTPDTSTSGFLDGMALAMVTGRCWSPLAASVRGFEPVAEEHVVLVGARDLDPAEAEQLGRSRVARVSVAGLEAELATALDALRPCVARVYLHIDLDVLDPRDGRANPFPAPDGLRVSDLVVAASRIAQRIPVGAAALTAYDPTYDQDGHVRRAGEEALAALVSACSRAPRH
jgi:arginase